MGTYNIIVSKITCPNCGEKLKWQSKYLTYDGFVLDNLLEKIPLNEHLDGEVYTSCNTCKTFIEGAIENGKEKITNTSPIVYRS